MSTILENYDYFCKKLEQLNNELETIKFKLYSRISFIINRKVYQSERLISYNEQLFKIDIIEGYEEHTQGPYPIFTSYIFPVKFIDMNEAELLAENYKEQITIQKGGGYKNYGKKTS